MTPINCPVKANYHLLLNWEPKTHVYENNLQYILVWDDMLFRSDQGNVIMYMVTVLPEFHFIINNNSIALKRRKIYNYY